MERVSCALAHSTFSLETGRMAKQADGAVLVQFGETMVLVAVVGAKEPMPGKDFFPLTVEYRERTSADSRSVMCRGFCPGSRPTRSAIRPSAATAQRGSLRNASCRSRLWSQMFTQATAASTAA